MVVDLFLLLFLIMGVYKGWTKGFIMAIATFVSFFAALALATEPPPDDILKRQPYKKDNPIITENMSRNVVGHAVYQIIVLLILLFAGPKMLIDFDFESQCALYNNEGSCVKTELNPYYTTSEYYEAAVWEPFVLKPNGVAD